ncbi:MAG: hypothetical protein CR993_02735 [Rhodobacterales bacterium]|nr:MAG: hypothetical protein CR993_02735 [Rhodobacterales bacterium]
MAKRIKTGNLMLLSHLIFYIGLIFLANLVRHALKQGLRQPIFAIFDRRDRGAASCRVTL